MTVNKIAYQGEPGANSHIACSNVYPEWESLPCATFEDALAAIADGTAELGMIPIENSIAGRVAISITYCLARASTSSGNIFCRSIFNCSASRAPSSIP